jgi:hypothetical protein
MPNMTPAGYAAWQTRTHGMTPGEPASPPVAIAPNFEPRPTTTEERLNKTEKSCLLWLRCLKVPGLQIQAVTFLLAADCRFTPDFSWFDENRRWTFGDCKGTRSDGKILIEEDAAIKLRTAARTFPWLRFVKLWVPKGGAWTIMDVQP